MGIFCTGRLLIFILFLAVLPCSVIVLVLLLLFEILQTDCTTSRFFVLLPQDVRLTVFVFVFTANVLGLSFTLSFSKAEIFLEGMGHPGASLNHALLHNGRWIVFLFVLEKVI